MSLHYDYVVLADGKDSRRQLLAVLSSAKQCALSTKACRLPGKANLKFTSDLIHRRCIISKSEIF